MKRKNMQIANELNNFISSVKKYLKKSGAMVCASHDMSSIILMTFYWLTYVMIDYTLCIMSRQHKGLYSTING